MTEYYDVVLGAIPIALISVTAVLSFAGLSLTLAIPLAATVSVVLIGHAMFVNGPVDAPTPGTDDVTDDVTDDDTAEYTTTGQAVAGD